MTTVSFPIAEVKKIYDHVMAPENTPRPTYEDLYNPDYWANGVVLTEKGEVIDLNDPNDFKTADANQIDTSKIPRSFHFVNDNGVYLIAGTKEQLASEDGKTKNFVTYAKGMNPNTDKNYYDEARYKFGGDDFAQMIPAEWFQHLLESKPNARTFRIKFGKRSISLAI